MIFTANLLLLLVIVYKSISCWIIEKTDLKPCAGKNRKLHRKLQHAVIKTPHSTTSKITGCSSTVYANILVAYKKVELARQKAPRATLKRLHRKQRNLPKIQAKYYAILATRYLARL